MVFQTFSIFKHIIDVTKTIWEFVCIYNYLKERFLCECSPVAVCTAVINHYTIVMQGKKSACLLLYMYKCSCTKGTCYGGAREN